MTPDEIKKAIKENDTTQKAIAEKLGVAEMSVSYIVNARYFLNII